MEGIKGTRGDFIWLTGKGESRALLRHQFGYTRQLLRPPRGRGGYKSRRRRANLEINPTPLTMGCMDTPGSRAKDGTSIQCMKGTSGGRERCSELLRMETQWLRFAQIQIWSSERGLSVTTAPEFLETKRSFERVELL